jgi:subtilisin family serine protease
MLSCCWLEEGSFRVDRALLWNRIPEGSNSECTIIADAEKENREMKKGIVFSIILLSMFALTIVPMSTSATSPTHVFTVKPVREQFVEAADFTLGDPVGTYVPWDVDIVNAEYPNNGGEDVYVAVIDSGLVWNWASFVAPGAIIETDLGRGWSYDIAWNAKKKDFDFTQNTARGFITNDFGSGHGTHVTCEIVGYQRSTIGDAPHIVQGVAPKVHIIPLLGLDTWLVKCPDKNYYNPYWDTENHDGKVLFRGGDDWMLVSAINYVASLAETYHPMICSNSWGSAGPSPDIRVAVDNAISKGVIFVFSAGNDGDAGMGWPGAYPEVISAAAGGWTMQMIGYPPSNPPSPYRWYLSDVPEQLDTKNNPIEQWYGVPNNYYDNNWQMYLATFSGRPNAALGQSWKDLDVCAPGCYVVGPYKEEVYWDGTTWVISTTTAYYGLWGTSMAAPHVAGIAAIIANQYPDFSQANMEYVLKDGASRVPMTSNTKWAIDPFYGPAFPNNDHDAGSGWLTVDNAMIAAAAYVA